MLLIGKMQKVALICQITIKNKQCIQFSPSLKMSSCVFVQNVPSDKESAYLYEKYLRRLRYSINRRKVNKYQDMK